MKRFTKLFGRQELEGLLRTGVELFDDFDGECISGGKADKSSPGQGFVTLITAPVAAACHHAKSKKTEPDLMDGGMTQCA